MNGVASNAGATFQTGDTINGTVDGHNSLNIVQSETANISVAATVNNISNVNINALGTNTTTYNAALWSNVGALTITQGVGTDNVALTNASSSTVFGVASATAENLDVSFKSGVTNQTFQVALAGAGGTTTATAASVDYVQTANANEINAITVATAGTNNVALNGTTNVTAVTVTGAGNNTIDLSSASALSTTKAVTVNVTGATGNNTIDLGGNLSSAGTTVNGSTGTSTTTLGLLINSGAVVLPTITNVESLQLDDGSNGSLVSGTTNTSVTSLTILDQDVAANANTYDLIGFSAIGSAVWGTNGGGNNYFGGLSLSGSGAFAETFAIQNGTALASTDSLDVDAQTLTGYSSLSINTAGGVGSGGTFTLGGVNGTALTSVVVDHAATGAVNLGTIDSTASTDKGTISLLDLDGIAGRATVVLGADSLAASSVILGSVGSANISYANGGSQTGASVATVTLLNGNNTYDATNNTTATRDLVTAGSGNNTIYTGLGADVITVGNGTNTIKGGLAADVITLGSGHTAAGAVDTVVFDTYASTDSVTNFVTGASTDVTAYGLTALNAELAAAIANSTVDNGNGVGVSAADAANFSALIGANGITFDAADNIFLTSATTAANVATYLAACAFAAGSQDGDGIVVAWVDGASDLHISLAVVAVNNQDIDSVVVNDLAVLTGTYTIAGLATGNFDFV